MESSAFRQMAWVGLKVTWISTKRSCKTEEEASLKCTPLGFMVLQKVLDEAQQHQAGKGGFHQMDEEEEEGQGLSLGRRISSMRCLGENGPEDVLGWWKGTQQGGSCHLHQQDQPARNCLKTCVGKDFAGKAMKHRRLQVTIPGAILLLLLLLVHQETAAASLVVGRSRKTTQSLELGMPFLVLLLLLMVLKVVGEVLNTFSSRAFLTDCCRRLGNCSSAAAVMMRVRRVGFTGAAGELVRVVGQGLLRSVVGHLVLVLLRVREAQGGRAALFL
jgi:hypothetical protein